MVHKVLIVGAGGHATSSWKNMLNLHGGFAPAGIVDTNPEVLEKMPAIWGIPDDKVSDTIDGAVDEGIVKKGDIALICTPINTHAVLCIEAMDNGLHIICEKNMAQSMTAGMVMAKAALAHPELGTVIGHQYPFSLPWPWQVRRAIKMGEIGAIDNVNLRFFGGGNGWQPTSREKQKGLRTGLTDWRKFLEHPFLEDWIIHYIDMLRYITGMDAVTVNADLWRPKWCESIGTQALNLQMLFAEDKDYEDPKRTLRDCEQTRAVKRRWQLGTAPPEWAHVNFHSNGQRIGPVQCGNSILIQGTRGSIEVMHDNYSADGVNRPNNLRISTYDPANYDHDAKYTENWKRTDLMTFRGDLECWPQGDLPGPGPRWMGDNTENEFNDQAFILEEMKQCIESSGKIKPLRCFENCIKTFAISMGAIKSAAAGGQSVWLPDLWQITDI
jgi:predicted dehydrogenase